MPTTPSTASTSNVTLRQLASGRWQVRWRDVDGNDRARNFRSMTDAKHFQKEMDTHLATFEPGYKSHHVDQRAAAWAREQVTARPAPTDGDYVFACPDCGAQPGEWCTAVFNLPRGILLRDPHDARGGPAKWTDERSL
jgi:hypothetical protein